MKTNRLKRLVQSRKFQKALVVFAVFLVFTYPYWPLKIVAARDVSLPYNVFFYRAGTSDLKVGDYVEFIPPVENKYTEGKILVKMVACGPGDRLTVRPSTRGGVYDYFCNGSYLCTSLARSVAGEPVRSFVYNGVIPHNKYFVMGTHPRSYDSRYFGFVDKNLIKAEVYPLW